MPSALTTEIFAQLIGEVTAQLKRALHLACFAQPAFVNACLSPVDVLRGIANSSMLAGLRCSGQRLLWHGHSLFALLPCIKCHAMLQLLEWEPLVWIQLKALRISQLLSASLREAKSGLMRMVWFLGDVT